LWAVSVGRMMHELKPNPCTGNYAMTTANDSAKMMIKWEFDKQAKGKSTITYESFLI
jgi:hypothetical protein